MARNFKKLVVANWKTNPENSAGAEKLLHEFGEIEVPKGIEAAICPPEPYLAMARQFVKNMHLGAQDAFWSDKEVATGEVAPAMLKDLGVKYVIVGHSERRQKLNETDEEIWRKVAGVVRDGMHPILCVGEPLAVRTQGEAASRKFVAEQLMSDTASLTSFCAVFDSVVIAYEPVWAISTNRSGLEESPEDAKKMIQFIKTILAEKCGFSDACVLYGGSVNKNTAAGFLSQKEIDGALVGHASLNAEEFQKILESAV